MAINESNTLSAANNQAIGQAVIVSGAVQVEAPDGSSRELQVNGQLFANETVITGGNGKVSIIFNDADQTQLDLGRMSEVTLDEDVFPRGEAVDLAEVALEVEQMQEALLEGDPTQDLPAPAAGPAAGGVAGARGGGHPTVVFDLTGQEVTPDSGAETIGVGRSFVQSDLPITQEIEVPVTLAVPLAPAPLLAPDGSPLAGNYENFLDEEHLADGTNPIPELMTISGNLGDMGVDFGPDGPGGIQFGGQYLAIDNLGGGAVNSIVVSGAYGNLTFYDNGTWSFNVPDNIYHPIPGATGAADSLPDIFGFTITDGNGTAATGTMTFNIYDDGPLMTGVEIERVVEEEAMELSATAMSEIVVTGANSTSVDSWHFHHNGGPLTIDLLSEYRAGNYNAEDPSSPWPDLNGDGIQEQVDTQIILLDSSNNVVAIFDDSDPALSGDGSTNLADSYGNIAALPPGNYTLAVGSWLLDPGEALLGTNFNPNSWGPSGPYQLTLTGDVDLFGVPAGGEIISQVLSDGNPDENDGPEDAMQPDAAVVNGNLAAIVNMGADNPGTFSVGILENLPGLSSQGGQVLYRMNANGTTIEAYVEGDSFGDESFATSDFQEEGGEERIVFTLDIQSNGDYVYTQLDQLDHEDDGTDSENTALLLWGPEGPVGTVDFIDFSSSILATDSDLDSIGFPDGIVTFTVVDDVPRLVDLQQPSDIDGVSPLNGLVAGMALGGVQEDALGNNTPWPNNPDADHSEGNLEPGSPTDQTILELKPLVEVGADEQLSWDITDPEGVDSGLTSDNAPVYYHLVDGVLVATTSAAAPADLTEPNIFTFSINEYSGEASFNLNDQLDHGDPGADEEHGTADDSPAGDFGVLFINNLGQYVQATDYDGDSVTLDGRVSISVENDVPRLVPLQDAPGDAGPAIAPVITPVNSGIAEMDVQEDALGRDFPDVDNTENNSDADVSLGNVDDLSDTDQAGYDLSALVETGADEELSWSLIPQQAPYESNLASGDETVFYEVTGNTLNAYTASVSSVFTFTVAPNSGEASFNLNDQIDHPDGSGDDYELSINDLGQFVRATDTDGDYVDLTGRIRVDVENDIPETLPRSQIIRTVQEDDMSIANPIPAGDVDGSEGNNEDGSVNADMAGARANGGLQQLVADGADEDVSFSISSDTSGLTSLWSHGEEVSYSVNPTGDTLVAEAGGRAVFTLTVNEDGSYLFDLDDQLDHRDDGQNSENFALFAGNDPSGDPTYVRGIDFSSVIQVTDTDEDTISLDPGQFAIRVQDDIPVAAIDPQTVGARVFEDGLTMREPDLSEGNRESGETTDWDEASGTAGSLSQLFAVGADEDDAPAPAITIGITTDQAILDGLAPLMSQGEAVTYSSDGTTLTGSAGGREVFNLNVNADGSWNFDLDDQLDHVDDGNNDENWLLEGNGRNPGIDFSSILTGEDFDGDMVTGAQAASFIIGVQDDIPVIMGRPVSNKVDEDDLDTALSTGTDGGNDPGYGPAVSAVGSLAALVKDGADEDATFGIDLDAEGMQSLLDQGLESQDDMVTYRLDSSGALLAEATNEAGETRTVFDLEVSENGGYEFTLFDQLDHPDGNGENMLTINLAAVVAATDFDGDSVKLSTLNSEGPAFSIDVKDDVPVKADSPNDVVGVVKEDGLSEEFGDAGDLSEGIREPLDTLLDDQDSAGAGSLSHLFQIGADENEGQVPVHMGITEDENILNNFAQDLRSQGEELNYSSNGTTLTATSADGREVFHLTVNEDGSWSFDLDDQLDHVDNNLDNENWELQGSNTWDGGIDFSAILTAEDFDHDMVTGADDGAFVVNVQDDVPESAVTGVQYFVSEYAGFDNIIGTYQLDNTGNPVDPDVLIASSNDAAGGNMGENEHTTGPWTEGTKVFLIADGGNQLPDDVDLNNLSFVANPDTSAGAPLWVLQIDGTVYSNIPVYFMDVALNADGYEHFKDENGNYLNEVPAEGGEIRIEDLSLGDADYDDTVLRVETGLVVDESNLANGTNPDSDALTVHGNLFTGEGMVQIIPGADENGTLTVNSQFITTDNTGAAIPLSEQSISLNGDHSVSISVNSEAGELVVYGDGAWEYTLTDNTLLHPDNDPGGADNTDGDSDRGAQDQVQDIFNLTYADADGDEINPQIVININDDGPETGEAQFAILANESGNSLVADLAIDFGADDAGAMTLNPIYNEEIVAEGDVVRDNNGEVMTYEGEALTWQQNPDGSWSAVAAVESEDDDSDSRSRGSDMSESIAVFTVALEEDAGGYTGNYTVELHKVLDGGEESEDFSLNFTRGGGHATERVFEEGDVTITVTAVDPDHLDPDYVNWSSQGMGVGNAFINEDLNQGRPGDEHGSEILIFNFTNSDSGDELAMNTASFGLDHLNENGDQPEVAIWTAYGYEADGVTETVVGTGEVTGELLGSTWKSDQEVTIDETNTTSGFYRVEFMAEHTANCQGYRVTQLEGSAEEPEGLDHTLSFVVNGTDNDGDAFDQQAFDVTFDGEGDIVGTEADEVIVGSSGDDVIDGGGGDDVIFGGEGDDTIDGGAGDDTILGGAEPDAPAEGNDTITGGDGADTFAPAEEAAGEVQDYAPDAPPVGDGDELDVLVPPVV